MIGGAGERGCEADDYLREASVCEGQELGGLSPPSPPPRFHRPWCELNVYIVAYVHGLHPFCPRRNGL